VPGTLAQFTVAPDRFILPVPDDIPAEVLAPIICAGVTAYKALKICEAVPGSWIAISGAAGGVGTLAIQYARAMGYRTIAIDGGQRQRELCMDLGAETFIDFTEETDIPAAIDRETNGILCSAFIECSGVVSAYETAPSCLDYFSVLVCVGIPTPTAKVSYHPLQLIDRGIKFKGSIVGTRLDTSEAIDFVRRGLVKPRSRVITLEDLAQNVDSLDPADGKLVISIVD
jgi:propanol-preferring alcohol dehydrogenase